MKHIYLIYDRKLEIVSKATADYRKALEEVERLNSIEPKRYTICVYEDFATK